ncbi:hypothetical protein RZS08_02025, partial [Arthrospira platensis SPKY1]|nr:hypothetical protein [Arthrospira platensis SPKY1]
MKVVRTDTSACRGISRSTDASTQVIHVKGWTVESVEDGKRFPILGRWEGYNEDDPDNRYTVETKLIETYAIFPSIHNLIPGHEPSPSIQ